MGLERIPPWIIYRFWKQVVKVYRIWPKNQREVSIARRHIGNILQNKKHAKIHRYVRWYSHYNLFHHDHEPFRVVLSWYLKFCAHHKLKITSNRNFLNAYGPERTRTAYLLIANEAFYQMNYGPTFVFGNFQFFKIKKKDGANLQIGGGVQMKADALVGSPTALRVGATGPT